jgi:hypothetical protein
MPDPEAELDPRFSDADTAPTSWALTLAAIEDAPLFWISTTRADGRPHVTPLVAVWLDDALHFCTGPTEQKALNLQAHPSVVLTTGTNAWDSGLDVMVEGEARRVVGHANLEPLAAAWGRKWDGRWGFGVTDDGFGDEHGGAHVFAVRPTKILAFGKDPFTHTRYRFAGA